MPKPTTHTDIVVISKQDPTDPSNGRVSESVQVSLASDAAPSAEAVQTTQLVEVRRDLPRETTLNTGLAGFRMRVGGKNVELGYEVRITCGPDASYAKATSEPRGWGTQLGMDQLRVLRWAHPTKEKAVIATLSLVLYGESDEGEITVAETPSASSEFQQVTVTFAKDGTPLGRLVLTAAMEAVRT